MRGAAGLIVIGLFEHLFARQIYVGIQFVFISTAIILIIPVIFSIVARST